MNILESLLSVFISPWQFFKESAPAPYIEVRFLNSRDEEDSDWQELALRPSSLSFVQVVQSLFYNPSWNEAIYIYDCVERLIVKPSIEDELEITNRIRSRIVNNGYSYFQFRVIFTASFAGELQSDVLFRSKVEELNS